MIVAGKLGSRAARQNKTGSTLLSDKVKVEPTHQNPGDHEWRERDSSHSARRSGSRPRPIPELSCRSQCPEPLWSRSPWSRQASLARRARQTRCRKALATNARQSAKGQALEGGSFPTRARPTFAF